MRRRGWLIAGIFAGFVAIATVSILVAVFVLGPIAVLIKNNIACNTPIITSPVDVQLSLPTSVRLNSSQVAVAQKMIGTVAGMPEISAKDRLHVDTTTLITGMQEGSLREDPPVNDRDSRGPFAQREMYYGPFTSVENATTMFIKGTTAPNGGHVPGLLDIPGWQTTAPAVLAQKIQRSAYPEAYANWLKMASEMLIGSSQSPFQQVDNEGCDPTALTGNADLIEKIFTLMRAQQGKPYVFGAAGPDAFDCSGLIYWVFKQVGITMPRVANDQFLKGPLVPDATPAQTVDERLQALKKGDLVFWDLSSQAGADHVGMYLGNGQFINAPNPSEPVRIQPMYWNGYVGATRPITAQAASGPITDGALGKLGLPFEGSLPVTSQYGLRFHPVKLIWKLHDGTDFGANCGTTILAIADGTITDVGYQEYGNGNYITITHGDGSQSVYAHLSVYLPGSTKGATVQEGQPIALSGTTGSSTACHLHLTIKVGGATTNPCNFYANHGITIPGCKLTS